MIELFAEVKLNFYVNVCRCRYLITKRKTLFSVDFYFRGGFKVISVAMATKHRFKDFHYFAFEPIVLFICMVYVLKWKKELHYDRLQLKI